MMTASTTSGSRGTTMGMRVVTHLVGLGAVRARMLDGAKKALYRRIYIIATLSASGEAGTSDEVGTKDETTSSS